MVTGTILRWFGCFVVHLLEDAKKSKVVSGQPDFTNVKYNLGV